MIARFILLSVLAILTLASSPLLAQSSQPPVPPTVQDSPAPVESIPLATCIRAISSQSDPAKLATLGSRQTNPRLKRIMFYLATARAGGADPGEVIDQAQKANGSFGTPRAPLVKASLLRNLKICDGLAMLDPENLARLNLAIWTAHGPGWPRRSSSMLGAGRWH